MAEKTYVMTLAEKKQLEAELEEYKLVRRPEVVERIKIARSYGDLSENSEYEAAKDEQAFVEGQIQILETKIRYAEIVDSDARKYFANRFRCFFLNRFLNRSFKLSQPRFPDRKSVV